MERKQEEERGAFHLLPAGAVAVAVAVAAAAVMDFVGERKGDYETRFHGGLLCLAACGSAVRGLCHIGTNLRFQNDWIYIINRGLPLPLPLPLPRPPVPIPRSLSSYEQPAGGIAPELETSPRIPPPPLRGI